MGLERLVNLIWEHVSNFKNQVLEEYYMWLRVYYDWRGIKYFEQGSSPYGRIIKDDRPGA